MIDLFFNGSELTNKTQIKDGAFNVNSFIQEGNYFLKTSDTSNMPSNYSNNWVWLFVKRADTRIFQALAPDNDQGWIAFRSVLTDNDRLTYSGWNVIDFKQNKCLSGLY